MPVEKEISADNKHERSRLEGLKQEIDRLFESQRVALDRATYLGMSADEAKTIEARRKQITALVDQLAELKRSG